MFARSNGLDALLHRPRRSLWQDFIRDPWIFLACKIYALRRVVQLQRPANEVSVICISDTHNSQPVLPDGDILIHAGDLTQSGSLGELQAALAWLRAQPHRVKIVVAGNHDLLLDPVYDHGVGSGKRNSAVDRAQLDWGDIVYLHDSSITVTCHNGRRINVYGSPKSPKHGNWAFQYPRTVDVWTNTIPDNTDILITHGPPRAHLDLATLGCHHLLRELWRVRPALHVFGHIHEGYGHEWLQFDELQDRYENILVSRGGLRDLLDMLRVFLYSMFRPAVHSFCQVVNPCMVGGLRDDQRRRPIVVQI